MKDSTSRPPVKVIGQERQKVKGASELGIWVALVLFGSAIWWFLNRLPGLRATSAGRVDPVTLRNRSPITRKPDVSQAPPRLANAAASAGAEEGLPAAAPLASAGSSAGSPGDDEQSEILALAAIPIRDERAGNTPQPGMDDVPARERVSAVDDRPALSAGATGAYSMGSEATVADHAWIVDEAGGAGLLIEDPTSKIDDGINDGERVPDATLALGFAAERESEPVGEHVDDNEAVAFTDQLDPTTGRIPDMATAVDGQLVTTPEAVNAGFNDAAGGSSVDPVSGRPTSPSANVTRSTDDAAGTWTRDESAKAAETGTGPAADDADDRGDDHELLAEAASLGIAVSPIWTASGSDLPASRFPEHDFSGAELPFELPSPRPDSTFPSLDLPGFDVPGYVEPEPEPDLELPSGSATSADHSEPGSFVDRVRDLVEHVGHDILDDDQMPGDRMSEAVVPDSEAVNFPIAVDEPDLFLPGTFTQTADESDSARIDAGFSIAAPATDFAGLSSPADDPSSDERPEPDAVTDRKPVSAEDDAGDAVLVSFESAIASPLGESERTDDLGGGSVNAADGAPESETNRTGEEPVVNTPVNEDSGSGAPIENPASLTSETGAIRPSLAEPMVASPATGASTESTSARPGSTTPEAELAAAVLEDAKSRRIEGSVESPRADSWIEARAASWDVGHATPKRDRTSDEGTGPPTPRAQFGVQTNAADASPPVADPVLPLLGFEGGATAPASPVDRRLSESFVDAPAELPVQAEPVDAMLAKNVPREPTFAVDSADSASPTGPPVEDAPGHQVIAVGELLNAPLVNSLTAKTESAAPSDGFGEAPATNSFLDSLFATNSEPGILISDAPDQPAELTATPVENDAGDSLSGAESADAAMRGSLPVRAVGDSSSRPEDERMYAVAPSAPDESAASSDDPSSERPLPVGGIAPEGDRCPTSHPIKGNLQSMIYHAPSWPSFAATDPEVCFADDESAAAAGFRRPKNAPRGPEGSGEAVWPERSSPVESHGRRRSGGNAGDNAGDDAGNASSDPDATRIRQDLAAPETGTGDGQSGVRSTRDRKSASREPRPKESRARQIFVPAGAVAGDGSLTCPKHHSVKGNANSRLYHLPGQPSYEQTIADVCFATTTDADNAGYRAVGNR